MKKTHAGPWTSKKEVLETIKTLHLKCVNEHYEHLYILPSIWLCLLQFETIGEEIYENLQNAYFTPLEFFVEKNFDIWDHKIHAPRYYLQSFYLAALIQKRGKKIIIHFRVSKWYLKKRTISSYNETMNNGTSSLSSDYETTPKFKKSFGKNINSKSNVFMISEVN